MKKACRILDELKCPYIINQNSYNIFNRTIENNGLKQVARECKRVLYLSVLWHRECLQTATLMEF